MTDTTDTTAGARQMGERDGFYGLEDFSTKVTPEGLPAMTPEGTAAYREGYARGVANRASGASRLCATGCGLIAVAGDRYCAGCASATDRNAWAEG